MATDEGWNWDWTNDGSVSFTAPSPLAVAHNGPVCSTCDTPYIGYHRCSREQLQRKINALRALRDTLDD